MPQEHRRIGIVVERRPASNPWADHVWTPIAVLPEVPDAAPWTCLSAENGRERFYAGETVLTIYAADTAHLRDGLIEDAPRLWVALRPTGAEPPLDLIGATVDPAEGEAWASQPGDIVETVPMPPEIAAWAAAFVAEHHVEQVFIKRQRDGKKGRRESEERGPPPAARPLGSGGQP